ncbi:cytochrome b5-like [Hibiscus syriacus]|uniref:Cytochrome b5-like n=1 Tax=Hibiscus syriacus TaxID=106335 RepID=A0A6A2YI65_HIBSY|nr:cytochrome b5-like [Hibiscus syriacus]
MENDAKLSIYRAARTIKRKDNSLYNALRPIYDDSIFIGEVSQLWPQLPLVANLRCGLWYSPKFHFTCYFKSTDGHTNNWYFNTSRLNFHIAPLAGQKGGCFIVDSTRRGKRFPDGFRYRRYSVDWDCSLHLPLWVSDMEKAAIEDRLEGWTKDLEASGADIATFASCLLRPLWISQRTVIWINEVPDYDSWDFTPIILVSTSSPSGVTQHRMTSEFSWNYIPGVGDDEESWARGLSPKLFWNHPYDLISAGPDSCNQKVADIVEKDRVYRAQRGQNAPQTTAKPSVSGGSPNLPCLEPQLCSDIFRASIPTEHASNVDCILNCDQWPISVHHQKAGAHLFLPIVNSKMGRFSLFDNLSSAVTFAHSNLTKGRTLLICCHDGEDISVCFCLAFLISLFDDEGSFDGGETGITKYEMRRRLVYICKFAIKARPSRGNLKQVFGFLSNGKST